MAGRLESKVALITGAGMGMGREAAVLFAREGADVAILYLCEHEDAETTKEACEAEGARAIAIAGDDEFARLCEVLGMPSAASSLPAAFATSAKSAKPT